MGIQFFGHMFENVIQKTLSSRRQSAASVGWTHFSFSVIPTGWKRAWKVGVCDIGFTSACVCWKFCLPLQHDVREYIASLYRNQINKTHCIGWEKINQSFPELLWWFYGWSAAFTHFVTRFATFFSLKTLQDVISSFFKLIHLETRLLEMHVNKLSFSTFFGESLIWNGLIFLFSLAIMSIQILALLKKCVNYCRL